MKNIIFDFDGTLADSLDVILPFANNALAKTGKELLTEEELKTIGVKNAIKKRKISKYALLLYLLIGRGNLEKHIKEVKIFNNLGEEITKLDKDHTIGIVTSSSEKAVKNFLTKYKLIDQFDFIMGSFGLFGKHKKILKAIDIYGLKKSETIYIGDETRDIEAARKAGVVSGVVGWGFEGLTLLKKSHPDFVFVNPKDLSRITTIGKTTTDLKARLK